MSIRRHIFIAVFRMIPLSRWYALKAYLLSCAGINISRSARIISSVRFLGNYNLVIGDDTFIGHEVMIVGGSSSISIGNHVDIASRVTIESGTHEIDMFGNHSAGKGYSKDIVIEDGVWIGACATILGGVRIGKKSIIAAGAVVINDIPPYTIAVGVPCISKKIWRNERRQWEPYN